MNSSPAETKIARLRYAENEAFVAESDNGHAVVTSFGHDEFAAPTPMEMLLISLGGCTGADIVSILEKKRQQISSYEIEVRGQRRNEHPRVYTSIEITHRFRGGSVDAKAVAHAIELSETKYCSVSAMLSAVAKITSRFEISEEEE